MGNLEEAVNESRWTEKTFAWVAAKSSVVFGVFIGLNGTITLERLYHKDYKTAAMMAGATVIATAAAYWTNKVVKEYLIKH